MSERDRSAESAEPVDEQKLIYLLRNKGPEDQETRDLLEAWTIQQEERIAECEDPAAESVLLNVYRARLYLAVGHLEFARENFEAARQQAHQFGLNELSQLIEAEMNIAGL